ncbi:MAG: choice-of-anchor D domain-containing protein [Deltaproteobacteria bacterium]|nr:choice-of-anchor D domain-containing protein [Deltaproteobacteria bacterium]
MRISPLFAILALVACNEYDINGNQPKPDAPVDTGDDTPVVVGPQPDIQVDPPSLDFGSRPKNCPSDPEVLTISNVGTEPLDISSMELVGAGSSNFDVFGIARDLDPGESYEVDVTFIPTAWTEFNVALRFTSNDPDEGELDVGLKGVGAEDARYEERWTQNEPSSVDVLWIIDNSGSMSDEVDALAANMPTFLNNFMRLGMDWQMAVVTTDMEDPTDSGRFQGIGVISPSTTADPVAAFTTASAVGAGGSADEKAKDAAYAAMTAPLVTSANAGLVRAGGTFAMIVISDEPDSSSMSTSSFVRWLDLYKGDPDLTSFSAMAGSDVPAGLPFGGGDPYFDETTLTGGFYSRLADMNFNEVLTYLSFTAAGMHTRWTLHYEPSNVAQIDVSVGGVDQPYSATNGFTYDPHTNSVVFHGDAIPEPSEAVVISYPYNTGC